MVACAEELAAGQVPDGKHEIAPDRVVGAIITPAQVRLEDQFAVAHGAPRLPPDPSDALNSDAVVESRVRRDREVAPA